MNENETPETENTETSKLDTVVKTAQMVAVAYAATTATIGFYKLGKEARDAIREKRAAKKDAKKDEE